MSDLYARPGYHKEFVEESLPVRSNLTVAEAAIAFQKLMGKFGISEELTPPALFRPGMTALHRKTGFWCKVEWMPALKKDWRRLEFVEFCRLFQIGVNDVEVTQ